LLVLLCTLSFAPFLLHLSSLRLSCNENSDFFEDFENKTNKKMRRVKTAALPHLAAAAPSRLLVRPPLFYPKGCYSTLAKLAAATTKKPYNAGRGE